MSKVTPYKRMEELEKMIVNAINKRKKKNVEDYFILSSTFGVDRELRIRTGKGGSRIVKKRI